MSRVLYQPEIIDDQVGCGRWMVVIFDNDTTPYDAVVEILMQATQCDLQEAYIETWEAERFGKAPVHFASRPECESAAAIINSVGVRTAVCPEWDDK